MTALLTPFLQVLGPALVRAIPEPGERVRIEAEITKALLDVDQSQMEAIRSVILARDPAAASTPSGGRCSRCSISG